MKLTPEERATLAERKQQETILLYSKALNLASQEIIKHTGGDLKGTYHGFLNESKEDKQ